MKRHVTSFKKHAGACNKFKLEKTASMRLCSAGVRLVKQVPLNVPSVFWDERALLAALLACRAIMLQFCYELWRRCCSYLQYAHARILLPT